MPFPRCRDLCPRLEPQQADEDHPALTGRSPSWPGGFAILIHDPCLLSHLHPVGAGKMCTPVLGENGSDAHDLARRRRIDLHAVPDVDADM